MAELQAGFGGNKRTWTPGIPHCGVGSYYKPEHRKRRTLQKGKLWQIEVDRN